jgi:holo-[acyl-carrier protein] synthase
MIIGIGTDIVEIRRFQRFLDESDTALMQRLFTRHEQDYCSAKKSAAASYAARFAAKEAFMKALGTGLRDGLSWQDMEIINNSQGKPEIHLSGRAATIAADMKISCTFLSLSHDGANAVAMVVLESL